MNFDLLLTVFFTSMVQSLFGTGVLLFGTPILILLGYEFQHALANLLPVSILINVIQIKGSFMKVELSFIKNLYLLSGPFIFFTLYFIKIDLADLGQFVGLFLIFIALKEKIGLLKRVIKSVLNYEYIYLILLGLIHGLTNLGGALLSAAIFNKDISKERKRVTIAFSYLSMALIQIATLILKFGISVFFNNYILYSLGLALSAYLITMNYYNKIDNEQYKNISDIFLLAIGIALFI